MVAFVQEPRLLPHQLLSLLDLPLPFVDAIHDGPELILPADEVRLPLLELPERLLPRFELVPERRNPTAEGRLSGLQLLLLHAQDVPIGRLHVDEPLLEFQDVFLLQDARLDLPLRFRAFSRLSCRIRRRYSSSGDS